MNAQVWVPIIVATIAVLGSVVTTIFLRRTSKDSNLTSLFAAISDDRHKWIDQLQEDAERHLKTSLELQARVKELEQKDIENQAEKREARILIAQLRYDNEEAKRLHHECRETVRRLREENREKREHGN